MYDLIKVLTAALLMPLPIFLLVAFVGLFLAWVGWRRLGLGLSLAGLVSLALLSWAPVADRLLAPFESQYVALTEIPSQARNDADSNASLIAELDYVVVLGAGWDSKNARPAGLRLSESSVMRLSEGLRLLKEQSHLRLVVSGASRIDESPVAWGYRDAAVDLGVPLEKIVALDTPTDTGAEARAFAAWLRKQGVKDLAKVRFALVTSASHLPRAMHHFEKEGLKPVAAPARFKAFAENSAHFSYWIPSATHLRKTERAWYEFLAGLMVQFEH